MDREARGAKHRAAAPGRGSNTLTQGTTGQQHRAEVVTQGNTGKQHRVAVPTQGNTGQQRRAAVPTPGNNTGQQQQNDVFLSRQKLANAKQQPSTCMPGAAAKWSKQTN
ncbi:hypothetical protein FRX31_012835 [Thalictrum thalictroides]|uniref:Uncharacterized protein n=1 Tax=Thalictrum thalictroides TaxID=46969 RepID=A0A7J6WKT9_THATH|nr:hypothetical protein FRX31_012835 [Thalictrum thalictroides]